MLFGAGEGNRRDLDPRVPDLRTKKRAWESTVSKANEGFSGEGGFRAKERVSMLPAVLI